MTSSLGSHPILSEVTQEALSLQRRRRLPVPLRLLAALAGLIALGTGLLLLPGMTTRPISFMDALFTATSAAAVTGLSVLTTSTDFTRLGQWVILFLMEAGGLGFMVTLVLTLRLLGRHISLVDRLAVSSSLGLASPKGILQVLGRTVAFMLAVEGIGALIFWAYWRLSGIVPAGDAAFYALFHSVAAFCNAGFDLFAGLPQYPAGIPTDPITLLTLGWLVIIGGLGIPVYMELLHRRTAHKEGARLRRLTLQTRLALWSALALVLVGWAGLLLSEYRQAGVLSDLSFGERVLRAWFQSAATRTAGFPGLSDFGSLHEASRLLLICLMFIGSAPASMGGGITTGTFSVLVVAMWSLARGYDRVRAGQRAISMATVWRAIVVLFISLGVVLIATWLLLFTQDLDLSEVLFEVVSAFSTTGLSLGVTGQLDTFGRLLVIA
ncbi:MAG TPA: potassium transporter TrkG, partial [Anaerolineae bacterium]|nr:potassium transporter TrkG [Anaerolineae bacterium]